MGNKGVILMNQNENIFLDSFIMSTEGLSESQIRENFQKLSESYQVKLMEKAKEFKEVEFTKENHEKFLKVLNEFINKIDELLESIHERSKYSKEIEQFKKLEEAAINIKKTLDSNTIRQTLGLPPKISKTTTEGEKN